MEILIGHAGEEILRPVESAFSSRKTLRASPDVRGARAGGHDENTAQLTTVGDPLQSSLPSWHGGDLVDKQSFRTGARVEGQNGLYDARFELVFVGNLVAVQEVGGAPAVLLKRFLELQLEPRALSIPY